MPAKLTLVHDADRASRSRSSSGGHAGLDNAVQAYEDLFDLSEPLSSIERMPAAQSLGGDLLLLTHRTGSGTMNWMDGSDLGWTAVGDGYHHEDGQDRLTRVVRDAYRGMKAPTRPGHLFVVASRASELNARTVRNMAVANQAMRLAGLPRGARTAETSGIGASGIVALLMWLADHAADPELGYMAASAQILATLGDADLVRFWGAALCGGEAQRTLFQDQSMAAAADLGRLWQEGWHDAGR